MLLEGQRAMQATLTANQRQRLRETIADPVRFSRLILGRNPWSVQERILHALNKPGARVAVKACHASGKTYVAGGGAIPWWMTRYSDAVAVSTAPTFPQVRDLLWKELRTAVRDANERGMDYPEPSETRWVFGADRWAVGRATNQGVRFQGLHGRVLIVLDEAPGILPDIWESIEGIAASGDVRILALGNPVIPSGKFYDIWARQEPGWERITISAFDTPNLEGLDLEAVMGLDADALGEAVNPNLTSRQFVRDSVLKYGIKSAFVQARVLGQFPDQAEDALISLAWLEASKAEREGRPRDRLRAGIDVAGPGEDETVLCIRRGPNIVHMQSWGEADPRGAVLAAMEPYKGEIERVSVDSIGIGYYFARHFEDNGYRGKVVDVNVGAGARKPEKFANLKAELYWGLRLAFEEDGVGGLDDEMAISQLAGIRYEHTPRGQIAIESKDDARKRGVTSPDRAEAIMLAFAETRPGAVTVAPLALGMPGRFRE